MFILVRSQLLYSVWAILAEGVERKMAFAPECTKEVEEENDE